jgi:hypothetical protein
MAKSNKYLEKLEEEASLLENKVKQAVVAEAKKELVDFDAWFAARAARIPLHHYKEIILADMKARGVAMMNEMHKFDEALAKYGIKLK